MMFLSLRKFLEVLRSLKYSNSSIYSDYKTDKDFYLMEENVVFTKEEGKKSIFLDINNLMLSINALSVLVCFLWEIDKK